MENKLSKEKIKKEISEWIFCFIIAYILYLLLNYYVGTISGVKQVSMKPTANEGEKLLIERTILSHKQLNYGDIVTFNAPSETLNRSSINEGETIKGTDAIANYDELAPMDSFIYNFMGIGKKDYIKRVIGKAGDHIVVGDDGLVYRNGEMVYEPYLKDHTTNKNGAYVDVVVPEGTIFVMGDNRLESMDSRTFGCIPLNKLDGYVIARVWPLNKIGSLK